ncbi:MAG: type II secretion system protein GspM [Gemmatimonadota bacterium]|jgi:hypothetical protein
MTPSFSRFVPVDRRLTPRERRVLGVGAAAVLLIVVGMTVVVPEAQRWRSREEAIAGKAMELGRLQALVAESAALERRVEALRALRTQRQQNLLDGRTPALAGSTLQSLIRGYGEQSKVLIQRLDPVRVVPSGVEPAGAGAGTPAQAGAPAEDPVPDLAPVGLSLSGRGDIYGLVDLLDRLQNGGTLLVVDQLKVTGPVGASDGLLTWTVRVTGFFTPGEVGA